jgi:DNA-binding transcriptional regulator YdaS (Cro superfamily)
MDNDTTPPPDALRRAADLLGGQSAVAAACGYNDRRHVWPWFSASRPIPGDKCAHIERATKGAVLVEELRPDLRWVRVADGSWPVQAGRPCLDVAPAEA